MDRNRKRLFCFFFALFVVDAQGGFVFLGQRREEERRVCVSGIPRSATGAEVRRTLIHHCGGLSYFSFNNEGSARGPCAFVAFETEGCLRRSWLMHGQYLFRDQHAGLVVEWAEPPERTRTSSTCQGGCRIKASNLPNDVTRPELQSLFQKWGTILRLHITGGFLHASPTQTGAWAYIDYGKEEQVIEAIRHADGLELRGSKMQVICAPIRGEFPSERLRSVQRMSYFEREEEKKKISKGEVKEKKEEEDEKLISIGVAPIMTLRGDYGSPEVFAMIARREKSYEPLAACDMLFVRSIPATVSIQDLQVMMVKFGPVTSIEFATVYRTAFVKFAELAHAERACEGMNGHLMADGQRLIVSFAFPIQTDVH